MRVALILMLAAFTPSTAAAQKQSVSAGRVAAQIGAGFVGAPLGFAAGYTIGSGFRPHGSSNTGVALGLTGAVLGPALGVKAASGPVRGNFGAAVGGAALGYVATYFVFPIATKPSSMKLKIATILAASALPAVGAALAYDATRK